MPVPAVIFPSSSSLFSLSQYLEPVLDTARHQEPRNVLLAQRRQAKDENLRRGHNAIAVALEIDVFRRVLEFSIPRSGIHSTAIFACEAPPLRFKNRWNSGPAALSKISGMLFFCANRIYRADKNRSQKSSDWSALLANGTIQVSTNLIGPRLRNDINATV